MPSTRPVSLDGSTLEGGGQLVRVALCLSAITGIPVHIYNIRANRAAKGRSSNSKQQTSHSKSDNNSSRGGRGRVIKEGKGSGKTGTKIEGGLKESHLAALVYLAHQCDAFVEGAEIGSREVTFTPGAGRSRLKSKEEDRKADRTGGAVDLDENVIELRNPGSVWLILQALLPYLLFRGVQEGGGKVTGHTELVLRGGTNVGKSMSAEYVQYVLLPTLEKIGVKGIEVNVVQRGWAGNASEIGDVKVRVPVRPTLNFVLDGFEIRERGELQKIGVHIVAGTAESRKGLADAVERVVHEHFGKDTFVEIELNDDSGDVRRLYVLLVAHTSHGWRLGRDYLGTGRKPANASQEAKMVENAAETVVRELKQDWNRGGCVDEHMQDQLVIFQALASGRSQIDGGERKHGNDDQEYCGDESGSLHTRTVRWVCEKVLRKVGSGVEFRPGGVCHGIAWNVNHMQKEDIDSAIAYMNI